MPWARLVIIFASVALCTILMAILLRILWVVPVLATVLAIIFGIIGTGVIILESRKKGLMIHCLSYCPIGLLATWLGRLSPFRINIGESCTECKLYSSVCRYGALQMDNIRKRRPGISSTLCGDCVGSCKFKSIDYRFFNMKPSHAGKLFVVMTITLHTVFPGIARIWVFATVKFCTNF